MFCAAVITTVLTANSQAAVAPVESVVKHHCIACHNDDTAEGDLNLTRVPWTLGDQQVRQRWIEIYDRVTAGEMPPDGANLSEKERNRFLDALGHSIRDVENDRTRKQGRGPLRRLTRLEYEDNLRDLLKLPHLDVADQLPEDRDPHGFTKMAELLDMSHVQLDGYLDAAEVALRTAIASGVTPPETSHHVFTGTDLFPATSTFGEREAMFFIRGGKMVSISNEDLAKMTPAQRRDPKIELALFRSAAWPYYGYPRGFRASRDGQYRVRFSARAVRQLAGFRCLPAYDPLPMSFRARQPSGPDVSGDVRETGGWLDLLPESKVFETTILLKAGETFEYSLLGLPVPFIRTDGGFLLRLSSYAARWSPRCSVPVAESLRATGAETMAARFTPCVVRRSAAY